MIQKAFILGAGLGTRLLPLTNKSPKPALPILGKPILEYILASLKSAGINEVIINTHHCPDVYEKLFEDGSKYNVAIKYSYEDILLDTGGGIKKVENYLDEGPFLVYNGDIITDGSIEDALKHHVNSDSIATMILTNSKTNKNVSLSKANLITDIRSALNNNIDPKYTFSGIHIIEPEIFKFIPDSIPISIIDIYLKLIKQNIKISGYLWKDCYWQDIGTIESYYQIQEDLLMNKCQSGLKINDIKQDGSDRKYYRITDDFHTNVAMKYEAQKEENNYFVPIAKLLKSIDVNTPKIIDYYPQKKIVVLEDLGNYSLCDAFYKESEKGVLNYYKLAIDEIIKLHVNGSNEYNKSQITISKGFDEKLYLWESNYFKEYFLENYLEINLSDKPTDLLNKEFEDLATLLANEKSSLIHRDFQSKNILIKDEKPYIIDFQGMRFGLPQYDLASLLWDPYVLIKNDMREILFQYYIDNVSDNTFFDGGEHFRYIFHLISIQRLMQVLGAYAYLGKIKGKTDFLKHMPNAINNFDYAIKNSKYNFIANLMAEHIHNRNNN